MKPKIMRLIAIPTTLLGVLMFIIGVSLYGYKGPPLKPVISEVGMYSFLLWLPVFGVGVAVLIASFKKTSGKKRNPAGRRDF